mmetsp:Transcript_18173/g.17544  ORF Transcript_18173/g.17544 Transcript_18173/m.17544 type:complete len:113 (-) Transcript_18173:1245-1583(-)
MPRSTERSESDVINSVSKIIYSDYAIVKRSLFLSNHNMRHEATGLTLHSELLCQRDISIIGGGGKGSKENSCSLLSVILDSSLRETGGGGISNVPPETLLLLVFPCLSGEAP